MRAAKSAARSSSKALEGIEIEMVPLASLQPPKRNVRVHPEKQIEELARSVERFGQIRPVVVDEDSVVLAGNGLVKAFERLGRKDIAIQRKTGLSKTDKNKLMLADNRLFALGLDDHGVILDMIREMPDFDIPGFDEDILRNLTLDTSTVTDTAMNGYGVLSDDAVAKARERDVGEGSTTPHAVPFAEEDAEMMSEGGVRCPRCSHVFMPK